MARKARWSDRETVAPGKVVSMRPDEERLVQYYQENFLQQNYWHLFNPVPYLYQRQQRRILRELLMRRGIDSPESLADKTIVDIGCGSGRTMMALIEMGARPDRITGVDLLPERIDQARAWTGQVDWRCGSIVDMDLEKRFDLVVVMAVLSSIMDAALRADFMRAVRKVMKPEGALVFYDMVTPTAQTRSEHYRTVGRDELKKYLDGLTWVEWPRSYLRPGVARRLVGRGWLLTAEALQSLRVLNSPTSHILAYKG
jgi:2-polyprenyl-3-methyl-5-hydroxy-6-metoxy-1,4-benzoquinol methylase